MPGITTAIITFLCCTMMMGDGIKMSPIWPHEVPDYHEVAKDGISLAQANYIVALVARYEGYLVRDKASFIERTTVEGRGEIDIYEGFYYLSIGFHRDGHMFTYPKIYYVSKMTGDIWETPAEGLECHRVSFLGLQKVQKKIMTSTGVNFSDEKSARIGILCTDD